MNLCIIIRLIIFIIYNQIVSWLIRLFSVLYTGMRKKPFLVGISLKLRLGDTPLFKREMDCNIYKNAEQRYSNNGRIAAFLSITLLRIEACFR